MLQFNYAEEAGFLILTIEGEIRVNNILELKKELATIMREGGNLAVNLHEIKMIDSSGISLLVNLYKMLESQNRRFCLFGINPDIKKVFEQTNLEKFFKIYATREDFVADNTEEIYDELFPPPAYDFGERLYILKNLRCVLCGSEGIKGFILNKRTQEFYFEGLNLIPDFRGFEGNNSLDIYGMQITICGNCFFASRHINYFTDLKGEFESLLVEKEIHTLVKEDTTRTRLLTGSGMNSADKFFPPFSAKECYWIYTMAEECAHTLYRVDNRLATYDLACYNMLLTRYCSEKHMMDHLRKGYMWYGEIHKNPARFSQHTVMEACYYLSVISRKLKREKESDAYFTDLEKLALPFPEYKAYLRAAARVLNI
jgi:anti-anti-sigma factor